MNPWPVEVSLWQLLLAISRPQVRQFAEQIASCSAERVKVIALWLPWTNI